MAGLAALADVPTSTVSRIESGKSEPTVAMLDRLIRAAGFGFELTLVEAGGDQLYADTLERLELAKGDERIRVFSLLSLVASVSPVARREGVHRLAVPGDLVTAVARLQQQGQNPVVSGVEAVAESIDPVRSFTPIMYVDSPESIEGFEAARPGTYQVMLVLPTTANVKRWISFGSGVPMVTREWGLLDAMASPGRQGDIAREQYELMKLVNV
jgi:hypothetical protein